MRPWCDNREFRETAMVSLYCIFDWCRRIVSLMRRRRVVARIIKKATLKFVGVAVVVVVGGGALGGV